MTSGYRPEIIQRAFVDFIGTRLHPFWSLTIPKLRLLARITLSEDLIALQFESNRAFKQQVFGLNKGWQGGQNINLSVPIGGIYYQRSYSLVGLPQQPLWWNDEANAKTDNKQPRDTITIAIKPQGIVSNYLANQAPLGTIFDSGIPSGDFTLAHADLLQADSAQNSNLMVSPSKKQQPNKSFDNQPSLLFIASGSGITPMLGLIKQALAAKRQVTLLHYNRTPVLSTYWQKLATKYPAFTYYLINTNDPNTYLASSRYLSVPSLLSLDLPLADTRIFACGSQTFLAELYRVAAEITLPTDTLSTDSYLLRDNYSLRDHIVIERFGTALPELNSAEQDTVSDIEPQTVYLRTRQREFTSSSTLLVGAEQAGLRMTYGCRQGICHMCRCNKVSGVVKNIQTGKISSDGAESIQTCINVPMTEVVLDI